MGDALPLWLRVGGEVTGRAAVELDARQNLDNRLFLNRLRLKATVQPAGWIRFAFEAQDARAFRLNAGPDCHDLQNTFEIRHGYVEAGHSERGFQARVGRQDLSVGDERLVGADSYWDTFGQTFDAVRVSFARDHIRLDAFSGFRVETERRRPDGLDTASRISGLTFTFESKSGHVVEPYLLWKRGSDTRNLLEQPGHRDVATPGLRATGDLNMGMDYNIEIALQRGHVVRDRIAAWAGHWEVGWKPLGRDLGPRLGIEYNFASGDDNPGDGRHETFDDLYPAGFNKFGISESYAWRNIRYPAVSVDLPLSRRLTVSGAFRSYWLATVRDGLYPGGDAFLVRNPEATSSHVGRQVFLSAGYHPSPRWKIYGGYGHLFPGAYLRSSNSSSAFRSLYLLTSFSF